MMNRRTFLRRTTAAALAFPAIVNAKNLGSHLHVAVVGCKGQGFADLSEIGSHARVKFSGFCDVDSSRFDQALKRFPGVPTFADYREMFSKLGPGIDAVQVSTPDHWHAPISLAAMRAGKHVYCQKPLTHTVWEARQMRLAADASGVITQMGNQIHSHEAYRTGVKLIRDGVIGKIKAVHSWLGNTGNKYSGLGTRPADRVAPPPATLNWDLWLGPAPFREFVPDLYAPFKWRDWMDFGGGTLGDFGCHILDPVFSALDLTAPQTIRAENEEPHPETWPKAETVSWLFPGTPFTAEKTLPVTWYDGGRQPDQKLAQMPEGKSLPGAGSLFIGEGGTMVLPHVGSPKLYPVDKFPTPEKVAGANHYHLWVDAIFAGTKTSDGFHYACPLTETVQLGNVATRVPGELLEWDTSTLTITNSPNAQKLITKPYRTGYEIPTHTEK